MKHFVNSVGRGLAIIQAFGPNLPQATLTQVAEAVGVNKATVRRFLLTLRDLGYVEQTGRWYRLSPKVLQLGFSYLHALDFVQVAQPVLERLSGQVGESTNIALLAERDVVYVARVAVRRIMTQDLRVGSTLPAYCTSLGKVLLAALADGEIRRRYADVVLRRHTSRTITSLTALIAHLRDVRTQGYAVTNEELEVGLRSCATSVHGADGGVVAAINISTTTVRTTMEQLRGRFVPPLLEAARDISRALGYRGDLPHEAYREERIRVT